LVLEEIGCFEHCDHHNKSPAHRGFDQPKTQWAGICSERKGCPISRPGGLAIRGPARALPPIADRCRSTAGRFVADQAGPVSHRQDYPGRGSPGSEPLWRGIASACVVYRRLTIQAYGSAHGRRRSAPALPVLRLVDAVQAPILK
jgi:hypothetical protein